MGKLVIDQSKVTKEVYEKLKSICPFGAIDYVDGKLDINAGCKTCRLCVKKGPQGVVSYVEEEIKNTINKDEWVGVCVYVECDEVVHPVVYELIGKAKELASVIKHPVYAIMTGNKAKVDKYANDILSYGVDKLYTYVDDAFAYPNIECETKCLKDFINKVKPSVILYGGTPLGRSLAPRLAQHFKTGLTADCTKLGMKENTDLIQVRPAFGGNVMAQIICTNNRPQMATVRYKIFKKPVQVTPFGQIINMKVEDDFTKSRIKLVELVKKAKTLDISESDIIVACGRCFKTHEDLMQAEQLANLLGGVVAVTRPLVEAGLKDAKYQIGLSGKTVAPKLIICLGISGAVQFTAGMTGSEKIIAVNNDEHASIFEVAHIGIVDDVFKVLPKLIDSIKESTGE